MLTELRIAGLGVIDSAMIEPAPGLTVVTGETGAGKTMIVTALALVCGGRGDSDRVRSGAAKAVIEARFASSDADLAAAADEVGGDTDDDGSLLAVRSVSADGRSRAFIGGRSTPVSALATLTEPLVTIHGQAEAMKLLQPAAQRNMLDNFAATSRELAAYRTVRSRLLELRADIADRTERARERAQREQLLRMGLDEIAAVGPEPHEDEELVAQVRRLDDADALRSAAAGAHTALAGATDGLGDEPFASALLQVAIRQLESASDPALAGRLPDLRSAVAVVDDVARELADYLTDLDADPTRLAQLLERQAALRTLTRRYGEDVDAVLAWARDAAAELEGLDSSEEAIAALEEQVAALEKQLMAAAAKLSAKRTQAAAVLGKKATAELGHLAMSTAAITVAVRPTDPGPDGTDQVELLLQSRPNAPQLALARSASGGELSRIMLALEVVLAGSEQVGTLIFDEVDAGVGGRAATEIGRRLALLAQRHQVLVVTHLAQVAAFADRHYVVDAAADGSVGASAVRRVADDARVSELARMLGGTDTDSAQAHAADLLAAATA